MTVPLLFETKLENNVKLVSLNSMIPENVLHETIGKLLVSATQTNNRVFISFPVDTALYKQNYSSMVNYTIKKYGLIEWKAITMTNEIHGHTGIYSIIGAKMGVRAMEYFNVGVNNMYVTTFAGKKPPLSCFNDGIQISTGATIGQGLISISDSVSNIPSAMFEFNNQKIQVSLKEEIARQMQNEIKYGIKTFGLLTDKYWLYIEELAIKYWRDFNKHRKYF
jgi:pyrimidine-specific ribonucleoside hydrolase